MEGLVEIFGFLVGRILFGLIGAAVRYCWYRLIGKPREFSSLWSSDKDEVVDSEDYKSRLVGLGFVLVMAVIAVIFLG